MAANENNVYGIERKLFSANDKKVNTKITKYLAQLIKSTNKKFNEILVLCIGTDRSTGDSFAPLIGYKLSNKKDIPFKVLGTLDNPIHAKNLEETLKTIDIENTLIIAIDACLGKMDHVGCLQITKGGLKPGTGVGKEHLPMVGDISITGIVNLSGYMDFLVLQNTRLSVVMKLADITTECVCKAIKNIHKEKVNSVEKILISA